MSPHAMNTFVSDLVEMARAVETLPQVQAQLDAALKANADLLDRIQSLELRLMDRASEIDALHAKIREAEQARDQAETMFLEETDRTASFKSFVENLFGTAGNLLKASAPPAPLAVPEVEQVQPEARLNEPNGNFTVSTEDQSEANPTGAPIQTSVSSESHSGVTSASTAESKLTEPPTGPYSGKWYSDHPTYVSLSDWLAGGGSEERYFGNKHAPRYG